MSAQWTDERNRLLPETVESILRCRVNYNMTCAEFYKYVKGEKELLKKAKSSVNDFFTPLNANDESLKLAAKEVTLAFHTCMHNHSFNYMTCTADLIAPYAMKNTIDGLKNANYISILVDASNHKAIKLVPVIARHFSPKNGVKNQILDLSSLPGETSDLIQNKIISVLEKFGIKEKIISYSEDNTNTNFGVIGRRLTIADKMAFFLLGLPDNDAKYQNELSVLEYKIANNN
ncbi:hypothetical protein QTP88_028270 [Uroleucon formosanum]